MQQGISNECYYAENITDPNLQLDLNVLMKISLYSHVKVMAKGEWF